MNRVRPSEANVPFLPNALKSVTTADNLACISDIFPCLDSQPHTCSECVGHALLTGLQQVLLSILHTVSPDITFNISHFPSSIPTDLPHSLEEDNILCYRCPSFVQLLMDIIVSNSAVTNSTPMGLDIAPPK